MSILWGFWVHRGEVQVCMYESYHFFLQYSSQHSTQHSRLLAGKYESANKSLKTTNLRLFFRFAPPPTSRKHTHTINIPQVVSITVPSPRWSKLFSTKVCGQWMVGTTKALHLMLQIQRSEIPRVFEQSPLFYGRWQVSHKKNPVI